MMIIIIVLLYFKIKTSGVIKILTTHKLENSPEYHKDATKLPAHSNTEPEKSMHTQKVTNKLTKNPKLVHAHQHMKIDKAHTQRDKRKPATRDRPKA